MSPLEAPEEGQSSRCERAPRSRAPPCLPAPLPHAQLSPPSDVIRAPRPSARAPLTRAQPHALLHGGAAERRFLSSPRPLPLQATAAWRGQKGAKAKRGDGVSGLRVGQGWKGKEGRMSALKGSSWLSSSCSNKHYGLPSTYSPEPPQFQRGLRSDWEFLCKKQGRRKSTAFFAI